MGTQSRQLILRFIAVSLAVIVAACSSGGGGDTTPPAQTYTIGGTLTGLGSGLSITLQNNAGDDLTLSADGAFTFANALRGGSNYSVTVNVQPTGQICTVTNGSGSVGSSNVTNVAVECVNSHSIGGTLTGLGSGLSVILQNNGGDDLTLTADGTFSFASSIADGSTYDVTVLTQPGTQVCSITNGMGTVASADVTNVAVACVDSYSVGGTLSGLGSGVSVTVQLNGGSDLLLDANGVFTFVTRLLDGETYDVTVAADPEGQVCEVSSGSGAIAAADVGDVAIDCSFSNVFGWQRGSNLGGVPGVYGALGIPAPDNVPGARNWNGSWQDAAGDLWIFGGMGCDAAGICDALNDMWRYSPTTGNWTWMSGSDTVNAAGVYGTLGVPSTSNIPGAREYMSSWSDSSGNLWLFGGQTTNALEFLNDLWRYTPGTGEWTWIGGSNSVNAGGVYGTQGVEDPANVPGARYGAIVWVDASDIVWLFGGYGLDSSGNTLGYMNDLWTFNPATGNWTWRGGSTTFSTIGVYGTRGVPAPTNQPGGRLFHSGWQDAVGNLWVFGGLGVDSAGSLSALNDLWRFDPSTGEWTWISGSDVVDQVGVYGTMGTADPGNVPGARGGSMVWADASSNLWLFAGAGLDSTGFFDDLSDVWKYDITAGEWTWINGPNTAGQAGIYGTLGEPSVNSMPGARDSGTAWIDSGGKVWLFGGAGYDSQGIYDPYGLNDLWEYYMP